MLAGFDERVAATCGGALDGLARDAKTRCVVRCFTDTRNTGPVPTNTFMTHRAFRFGFM